MNINLEDGELTPSPTEREPSVLKIRQSFQGSTTHLDDDPEIARLYQEALYTLPDTKNQREIPHRFNGQIANVSSLPNHKKRKRKRAKNVPSLNQNFLGTQKNIYPGETSPNKINSPVKRKRDSSAYSNSVDSRGNAKRFKSCNFKSNINKITKKPTLPKMPSSLAAEVSRYFNTKGIGTFNAEEIFETVWDMTVNELRKLDKKCKELHLETIIAENMVQEQIGTEKRYKRELVDIQGKYMKNVNYTDISSGNLRLPAKLNEAMMKHDCCLKILEELKEQYTLKYNKYQVVAVSFKKFTAFHKHLFEYKKLHDNFLMELDSYNQGTNDYNNKHNERDIIFDDEVRSVNYNRDSDLSDHSSDMSLCSRNSPFRPPPSPPLFNQENNSSCGPMNTFSSSSYGHENRNNLLSNSPIFDNNDRNNFVNNCRGIEFSPSLVKCTTSDSKDKQKDFNLVDKNISYGNTNFNSPKSINNCIEEVVRSESSVQPNSTSNLKDGNSLYGRAGSWTNMQTYTKKNENSDDLKKRQLMGPVPINNCSNFFPSTSCNGTILQPVHINNHIEPEISPPKDKENGMTPAMVNRYNSSIEDIDELLCYYDLYGQCKDNKCKSLHGMHKKVLMDCIDYCIRSEDIFISLPKPIDETLAYFVFTVLRENNYNYKETIKRLQNFVNNGYNTSSVRVFQ
ncbi:Hypothetical protein SRAE_2000192300 [Strongyloides ratti]|uniref:C3H1-type domain-containing protein n=1 Tax=Strongyloides ratti TaxID=34506 RepID=A0A090MYI8_STRRB|nr:Hypothetical protein SRAE_2000192300 [Strongyloides ratti]CEF67259.1 Hypothetical protein SRAE_2000192300 [Strongyloides ratti]